METIINLLKRNILHSLGNQTGSVDQFNNSQIKYDSSLEFVACY